MFQDSKTFLIVATSVLSANLSPALVASPAAERTRAFAASIERTITDRRGGGFSKSWKGHGVSADIRYGGRAVLKKTESSSGTYCVGATFQAFCEAYLAACRKTADSQWLAGRSMEEFDVLRYMWYVRRDKIKAESFKKHVPEEMRERAKWEGCALALEWAGIGKAVPVAKLKRGDFVQFWWKAKNKNGETIDAGHSAIVWRVDKDKDGKVSTIWYWSSQGKNYDPSTGKPSSKPGYGLSRRILGKPSETGKIYRLYGARVTSVK